MAENGNGMNGTTKIVLGSAIAGIVAILVPFGTCSVNNSNKLAQHDESIKFGEIRLNEVKESIKEVRDDLKALGIKLDGIKDLVIEIKLHKDKEIK